MLDFNFWANEDTPEEFMDESWDDDDDDDD